MPEVQAQAERMAEALAGQGLTGFRLFSFSSLKTFPPGPDEAKGSSLLGVTRRGKYLLLGFDNGHTHIVHLMQGGRLKPDPKASKKPRGGIARWTFTNDAWLLTEAGTERRAGVWVTDGDPSKFEQLARLGPEADTVGLTDLAEILGRNSKRIHGLLRRQGEIAGIGRMLANEICFAARVSPFAVSSKLSDDQVEAVHRSIGSVIAAATDHERTLDAIGKSADRPSAVHNRAGQPCSVCSDGVRSVEYRAYTVFYCPTCQTGGKVLADNTTSEFLK